MKYLGAASLVFFFGCASPSTQGLDAGIGGGGGGGGGGDDLSVGDSSVADLTPGSQPDLTPLLKFGDPCTDKSQCDSNICVFTGIGGVCSRRCDNDPCPMGYGCYSVLGGIDPGVAVDLCVPETNRLCNSCTKDQDCATGVSRDLCMSSPSGATFCARDCTTVGCPNGFQCKLVTVADMSMQQCIPNTGSCDCNNTNSGITKGCTIQTPYSVCTTPTITCNGNAGWGACTPPSTTDKPDDNFTDENCDGIDGDISKAIFVDCVSGKDTNPGTIAKPVATVQHGVAIASVLSMPDVYVSKCSYSGPVTMAAGVSIYGGYDAGNKWQRSNANVTTISGSIPVVDFNGLNAETRLELFTLVAADASGGTGRSSYGVRVVNSSGPIYVRTSSIRSGTATGGAGASNGSHGQGKDYNSFGYNYDGATSTGAGGGAAGQSACGSNGGRGGDAQNAGDGGGGGSGNGPVQVGGGHGGPRCEANASNACGCGHGGGLTSGNTGPDGASGFNGSAAPSIGGVAGADYSPANGFDGTDGADGSGGSGGGAGGGSYDGCFISCCDTDTGGGGGGGGAGGCRGTHGTGGGGGGASFAIFSIGSTVFVDKCSLTSGRGGDGTNGGGGGQGGAGGGYGGGGPGTGDDGDGQPGAQGGPGGHGGTAGSGAGGTGGPSACVAMRSSSVMQLSGSCSVGSGGSGGSGGSNGFTTAPNGSGGAAAGTLSL